MTNEKASVIIGNIPIEGDDCYTIAEYQEAKARANKALEAQPSEDCISRQAVLDYAKDTCLDLDKDEDTEIFCDEIKAMPPVIPKYTDEEIDKAQAVEQAYVDKMVELAVEETKRPKGKWIKIQSGDEDFPESIVCSRCKNENSHLDFDEHSEPIGKIFVMSKYCPNCGAEMEEGGEDG